MYRLTILLLPLALLIVSCENKEPADKNTDKSADKTPDKPAAKAKSVKVAKGLCKVEVSLQGVLAAAEPTDVRFTPKTWAGPFTVRKVVPHGTNVEKGDVLVEFETTKLDRAIRDLESEQRLSELAMLQAEAELPVLGKLMPVELAEAERLKKQAIENQERFLAVESREPRRWPNRTSNSLNSASTTLARN
jgi:multidrug efflux pump subunit AcrA (membrane-fusion protein)